MFVKYRKFQVGIGKGRASFSGQLTPDLNSVGSATTGEKTLNSVLLPANSLYKNGVGLNIRSFGLFAANANTKQIKIYAGPSGTTLLLDCGTDVGNNIGWYADLLIFRTGSKAQIMRATYTGTAVVKSVVALTLDDTVDQLIAVKGTAATANNDILGKCLSVEALTI